MRFGTTHASLKPLDEIVLPDPRFESIGLGIGGNFRPFDLLDLHSRLNESTLLSSVPEKIRCQYETARNMVLYSWFVFEFHTLGELQAFAALELALRTKFPNAKKNIKRKGVEKTTPLTLRPLLAVAIEAGSIHAEKTSAWKNYKFKSESHQNNPSITSGSILSPANWLNNYADYIANYRNSLAHGEFRLDFMDSIRQLDFCADLINQLFPPAKS